MKLQTKISLVNTTLTDIEDSQCPHWLIVQVGDKTPGKFRFVMHYLNIVDLLLFIDLLPKVYKQSTMSRGSWRGGP